MNLSVEAGRPKKDLDTTSLLGVTGAAIWPAQDPGEINEVGLIMLDVLRRATFSWFWIADRLPHEPYGIGRHHLCGWHIELKLIQHQFAISQSSHGNRFR